jgi:hypothetical protein
MKSSITDIDINKEEEETCLSTDGFEASDIAFNYCFSPHQRFNAFLSVSDSDERNEMISKLVSIYNISPISSIGKVVRLIAQSEQFNIEQRLTAIETLFESNLLDFDWTESICRHECFSSLPLLRKIHIYTKAICVGNRSLAPDLAQCIIESDETPQWKCKTILQLEVDNETRKFLYAEFLPHGSEQQQIRMCSALFRLDHNTKRAKKRLHEIIGDSRTNYHIPEHIRADACDALLHYEPTNLYAQQKLDELGGKKKTFFENKQNVHLIDSVSVAQSIDHIVQKITLTCVSKDVYEYYKQYYLELIKDKKEIMQHVSVSFERIETDQTNISWFKYSVPGLYVLQILFCMISLYIEQSSAKEVLENRMIEELIDMSGTCASGFIIRFINVLVGFETKVELQIKAEEQLKLQCKQMLTSLMQDEKDEDVKDKILETMANTSYESKSDFLSFIQKHISEIRETLYQEYQFKMTDEQFDTVFGVVIRDFTQM